MEELIIAREPQFAGSGSRATIAAMSPVEFVSKWSRLKQKESALYARHFDDVCRLVGHPTPAEYGAKHDPTGERFSFLIILISVGKEYPVL